MPFQADIVPSDKEKLSFWIGCLFGMTTLRLIATGQRTSDKELFEEVNDYRMKYCGSVTEMEMYGLFHAHDDMMRADTKMAEEELKHLFHHKP